MDIEYRLLDTGFEDIVYFPDFDEECIVGIDTNGRVVYSFDKMVEQLVSEGMSDVDAIDYIEYNTIRSLGYIDSNTEGRAPIVMYSFDYLGV